MSLIGPSGAILTLTKDIRVHIPMDVSRSFDFIEGDLHMTEMLEFSDQDLGLGVGILLTHESLDLSEPQFPYAKWR